MNKRIKEIEEQCYEDRSCGYCALYFNREKFAELIIKECAHIAWLNTTEDQAVHEKIKKHFGVE